MDVQRTGVKERRQKQRLLLAGGAALVAVLLTFWIYQLEPAAPIAERANLWIDQVGRGPMLRDVRAPGSLVPEESRWLSLSTEGVVERIVLRPGVTVTPDSIIVELTNPELEQRLEDARLALAAGEADLTNLRVGLESDFLTQTAEAARIEADWNEARLQLEANEALWKDKLISELDLKRSRIRAEQLARRVSIEKERIEKTRSSHEAQLAANRAQLDQLRAIHGLRRAEVGNLFLRAGLAGVLQEVPVEVGQRIPSGQSIARVANPTRLKAELRVAETQAKDLVIGLVAEIDTRNGIVQGRLARIDPAVRDGSVLVDVTFDGPLPAGARPDLSVDGRIEIERLDDVLFVARPSFGNPHSQVGLFRLDPDGDYARRVQVLLGRASVDKIEIVSGLEVGNQVIVSDTSQWQDAEVLRVR
jgi:HlyD family secretion protein